MPQVINTNIPSLNAQRNLNTSQTSLATSLQRLSSGLRINSAKDDAAGLAISNRMTTQIRGINQAMRNANDGISLAQTGEGALAEITNNLQRVRELAVQATNSTNSTADRQAINLEVQQRLAEIDRTASQTAFNGTKLLDGSFTTASFQVGANAGETIGVNLSTNVRLSGTGAIAATDSSILGAGSHGRAVVSPATRNFGTAAQGLVGGYVTSGVAGPSATNFAIASATAVNGTLSFTATDFDFHAATAATSTAQTITAFDFSAGSALVPGKNVQGSTTAITQFDFSGAALAQFNVSDGTTTANITLNANYTDVNGLAAALQTQVRAAGAGLVAATVTNNSGVLTFSNVGLTPALAISSVDANATTAGFAASAGVVGAAAAAGANFTVNGTAIALSGADVNIAGVAAEINTKIQASALADKTNYSANVVGSTIVISHNGSVAPVVIGGTDAKAKIVGFTDSAGVAGVASSLPAALTIDGNAVALNQNYFSYDNLATQIGVQINTAVPGKYSVTNTAGAITVTRTGTAGTLNTAIAITGADANATTYGIGNNAGTVGNIAATATAAAFTVTGSTGAKAVVLNQNYASRAAVVTAMQGQLAGYTVTDLGTTYKIQDNASATAATITSADAGATNAGFATSSVGSAGTAAVATTNASFTIGGQAISLTTDYASYDAMATDIAAKMNTAVAGTFTVTNNNGQFTIARTTSGTGSAAVAVSVADAKATAAGFATSVTGTAGVAGVGAVTTTNLSVNGTLIAGAFTDAAALAAEINSKANNVYAKVDSATNVMTLSSSAAIVLAGSDVTTLGLNGAAAGTVAASSGSLATSNTLDVASANTTIQRIDSALNAVSDFRSTFGALQNRFDSVNSSLSATSENLTAARSRIQDADFAVETAALTRNQILQQAGIAMLAQANSLPQSVLSLLK